MRKDDRTLFERSLDQNPTVRIIGRELKGITQEEAVEHDWTANKSFDTRPFHVAFWNKIPKQVEAIPEPPKPVDDYIIRHTLSRYNQEQRADVRDRLEKKQLARISKIDKKRAAKKSK